MAWTAPMTAVDGTAFTAAQFNTNVRDNLLETMPAKALTVGDYLTTAGTNSIVARRPYTAYVATSESTLSTAYTDLTTTGPTLTSVDVGAAAFVYLSAEVSNAGNFFSLMSFSMTGIGALPADTVAFGIQGTATRKYGNFFRLITTPGVYTLQAKYRSTSGANAATFAHRWLTLLNF